MEAQYILGLGYYLGEGVEINSEQGVYLFEQAANLAMQVPNIILVYAITTAKALKKTLSKPYIGSNKLLIREMQMPNIILV
ncbi:MAG: SEL1-like repeat protein [Candidatus Cloacimonetes bacterium]|nr:SEL1-like repeat protein [Candidatus Cloacimonadota bacterium]